MREQIKQQIADIARDFRLPRYEQIPNMGLYLEQTTKYISEYLSPLQENLITSSMISNYVKKDLVENPVKKLYNRDQIAYLIFITLAKHVLSLDNLSQFIQLQKCTYSSQRAYDYFCDEFENVVQYVFGAKSTLDNVGMDSTDEKFMLRATIITAAHKFFLEKCFEALASVEK